MPLISLSVTSTLRTTKRNMKYDPARKSSHPDEAEILSPIEGNDKVQYLNVSAADSLHVVLLKVRTAWTTRKL
jgi:hypothetical protein